MNAMLRLGSAATLGVLVGLFGACQSSDAPAGGTATSGSGGAPGTDLNVPGNDPEHAAGASGAFGENPGRVSACEQFTGLDECGTTSVEASFSSASVLLVIDKSSSMDDQPEGFELKKWAALKAALAPALTAVQGEMSFGLLLYPFGERAEIPLDCFEGCCEVPAGPASIQVGIEPGTTSVSKILGALDATKPGGGTPTAAALDAALSYFTTGEGSASKGERFVLLATDGGPNCGPDTTLCAADHCTPNLDGLCPAAQGNCCVGEGSYCLDDAEVTAKIRALAQASVRTFVVGIPGTERYADYLDAFATAGGVPNPNSPPSYYAVSAAGGVEQLTQTFIDITTHLVRSCDVELGPLAPPRSQINVAVDCGIVPFDEGTGWDIRADAPSTLVLAGDTCRRVRRQGARRIDVVYGCPTVK